MIPRADNLTLCTTPIECELANGRAFGTGFFFSVGQGTRASVVLVTNKHVVADVDRLCFRVHLAGSKGVPAAHSISLTAQNMHAHWFPHPDPTVDLGALRVQPLIEQEEVRVGTVLMSTLDATLLPTAPDLESLTAIEDIVMVGYPNGLWDRVNNRPIVRRGITATHPALDWEGRQEFLIDAACFPGSSGSPVFLYNAGSYGEKGGGLVIGSRLKLLGVLYAGPQATVEGEIVIRPAPTQHGPLVEMSIPNNLGVVLKAARILELSTLFGV